MVVADTGWNTFIGRTMSLVDNASSDQEELSQLVHDVGPSLLVMNAVVLLFIWILSLYRSNHLVKVLRFTLNLVITGLPLSLRGTGQTVQAVRAGRLIKNNILLQHLSAIEALAAIL